MKKFMFFIVLVLICGFLFYLNRQEKTPPQAKIKNHAADLPRGTVKNTQDQDVYYID